jgi:hypothetical protein
MVPDQIQLLLEKYLPKSDWNTTKKISINYEVFTLLKWISIFGCNFYKKYYLRVTYDDNNVRNFKISKHEKDILKPWILKINFYLFN